LASHDWDVYSYVSRSLPEHILVYTPYIWIFAFLVFILFANYIFAKTKGGYRFESRKALLVGATMVLVLMLIFLFIGMAQLIHETIFQDIPQYDYIIHDKNNIWDHPDKGLLSGQVLSIQGPKRFDLADFRGNLWQVQEQENIKLPVNFIIKSGDKLKIIGIEAEGHIFIANTIKLWDCGLCY
jgi:hypothetical protein